jgi:hypothetical protein
MIVKLDVYERQCVSDWWAKTKVVEERLHSATYSSKIPHGLFAVVVCDSLNMCGQDQ